MACHLSGSKPLTEQMLIYFQWTLWKKCSEMWIKIKQIFIEDSAFENDVFFHMAAILFGGSMHKCSWCLSYLLHMLMAAHY